MTMPLPELAKVANLYARSSPDDPIVAGLRDFIADVSPLVYVMADTKVGKTHWLARLFQACEVVQSGQPTRYPPSSLVTPVRYIDADEGAATFGHLLESQHLNYQRCTRPSKEIRPWMIRQIAEASDDKHCKAIVIEGLNLIYETELAIETKKNPECEDPWKLAKVPATNIRNLLAQIRAMKIDRRKAGIACPIFVSLNIKTWEAKGGEQCSGPNMSRNNVRRMMEGADAVIEIMRNGTTTTLSAYDSSQPPQRTIRAPDGASLTGLAKLVATPNLDPLGLMLLWSEYCRRLALKDPDVIAAMEAEKQNESTPAAT